MSETLTHWKKNNDPRYISGEDLQDGEFIGKGLKAEMVVTISHFEDTDTFDQNKQAKTVKTGFWLKEYPSGKPVYKPVILNNTNAAFFIKEANSPFMEKWLNLPVILWAMPDKRWGHVARFKKYYPPVKADADKNALELLNKCTTLAELGETWTLLSASEKKLPTVLALKEKLKSELS
jgi:hypothetical protein